MLSNTRLTYETIKANSGDGLSYGQWRLTRDVSKKTALVPAESPRWTFLSMRQSSASAGVVRRAQPSLTMKAGSLAPALWLASSSSTVGLKHLQSPKVLPLLLLLPLFSAFEYVIVCGRISGTARNHGRERERAPRVVAWRAVGRLRGRHLPGVGAVVFTIKWNGSKWESIIRINN